jgi:hypothetical protein
MQYYRINIRRTKRAMHIEGVSGECMELQFMRTPNFTHGKNNSSPYQQYDFVCLHGVGEYRRQLLSSNNQAHRTFHDITKSHPLFLVNEIQKLLSNSCRRLHATEHAAGCRDCACLLDSTHHHTKMARLYYDGDTLRLEHLGNGNGNLFCKAFLYLESAGERLGDSSELGEPDHSAVGDVANVHLSEG